MSQREEDQSHHTRTLVVKPALSQMYDQLLPKSKSPETACKNHCTHTSAPCHVSVPWSRNFSDWKDGNGKTFQRPASSSAVIISTDDDAECRNVLLLRSVCDQQNHPPVSHCVSITTMRVISKMSFEPLTIHLHHKIPTKREALSYIEGMIKRRER